MNDQRLTIPQARAVDTALNEAHRLFQNEVSRQREMYLAHTGRYPYYNYEHDLVASNAKKALSAATRAILGV